MIKIDIFSGFLGAGKTTLIKKLISEALSGERLVVIENEFGDIGIDGGFLKESGIQITEMNSGCICCSLVGDFGKALREVIDTYAPERIIIEPSGVGKLSDVIKAVADLQLEGVELNTATAVVDAKKCKMYMKNFGEFFNNQIESASAIVFSHTQGLSEEKLAATVELVRNHNEKAELVTTPWDELSGVQILSVMEKKNTLEDELRALSESEICPECGHHHHEHHHHHHDEECDCGCHEHHHEHHHHHDEECDCGCHEHHHHHHADEVFTSWGKETSRHYTESELRDILSAIENEGEYGMVLRAKGIVAGEGCWYHFDYTPGEADVRVGGAAAIGRLCVIGSKINEEKLSALFR